MKRVRRLTKEEMKAKRRKERRRIVLLQRLFCSILVIAAAGGIFFAVWNFPALKLERQLHAGEEYTQEAAYEEALASYEKALKIDSTSVQAYRYMANTYLDMQDESHAKQILYEGWENTKDDSLLKYYCTTVLNEAVEDINGDNCSFETIGKIINVLEQNIMNEEAYKLMHTSYEHLIGKLQEKDASALFLDEDTEKETCAFEAYENIMNRLFALDNGTEEMKQILSLYAYIDVPELKISRQHIGAYEEILKKVESAAASEERQRLLACMNKDQEIQKLFGDMFTQFDAGNYEAAKDFIVSETYTGIRDAFINQTMEYWSGATYIPVSREYTVFRQDDTGAWTFSYPPFEENENTAGVITVAGNKMMDDGIQRTSIAYEPAKESENYYPHTEYAITYMFSNVQKKNTFKAEMNYHLETRTWTEEGMTTIMIGDWGGPYQWEKTY